MTIEEQQRPGTYWNGGKFDHRSRRRRRGAVVKEVTERHDRTSLLRRPLQKQLYPLEHGADHATAQEPQQSGQVTDPAAQEPPREPQQSPVQAVQSKGEASVPNDNDGVESNAQEDCCSHGGIAD